MPSFYAVAPSNSDSLRFALVHDWLTVPGGSEDVFREICSLFPGVVFTSQWDAARIHFPPSQDVRTSFVQRLPLALTKHYLYAPILPGVYRGFDLREFDVVLSDSHSFAHGVIKRPDALHVNYYHTPARSLWAPEVDARATSGSFAFLKRLIARRLKALDLVASRNPDVILANSKTTAARIKRAYSREVDAVIYPPVRVDRWLEIPRRSDRLGLLYFGRLIPYKRVDLAIQAAIQTGDKLQIVGEGPLERSLKEMAVGHPDILFHGRLPNEDLAAVVSESRALLFPGYEDFGIVPVEAMAAGLPVVAFAAGGVTESVLPEFGEFFDTQRPEALGAAIQRAKTRSFDSDAMRLHARRFRTERFRDEYRAAINGAIAKRPNRPA